MCNYIQWNGGADRRCELSSAPSRRENAELRVLVRQLAGALHDLALPAFRAREVLDDVALRFHAIGSGAKSRATKGVTSERLDARQSAVSTTRVNDRGQCVRYTAGT